MIVSDEQWRDSTIHISSVQFSCSFVSDSLRPHESQHTRPPCPSPTLGVYSNPCPSSRWCHPAISSSVVPFSSCPQSFPASESFPMSQLFTWGGQSIGAASTSVLPMNTQDWSPLGWTGWIFLHAYIYPFFPKLPSHQLPHNPEQSSMGYTAGPCWLSILIIAVCTCPSQTPKLSSPLILPPLQP